MGANGGFHCSNVRVTVLVLALPPGCWLTSDKSSTCKVGTAKKEAPMYRASNTAKELHTGFFFHLIHMVTLFIKEVIIMDSNPGLTDLRALFSTMTALIYVSPDRVVVRTLLKSHAHSFKTLC